ncbi:MAG: hypothetical protein A2Y23_07095 [Clostridiales bacterium GWB2_37_7]|nr:MAG: hypothetical protein A2Y23_07095 [Clostridiales bacterium GWB2_37_7]
MGRAWREEYSGGIYHVIARGNNKEYIFKESVDKSYFIKLLKENMEGMSYRIYGYVLMDNHYHIILQVFEKKRQKIMHQINNAKLRCLAPSTPWHQAPFIPFSSEILYCLV